MDNSRSEKDHPWSGWLKLCVSIDSLIVSTGLILAFSGADLVEVAPDYDHGKHLSSAEPRVIPDNCLAEITAIAAADLVHDFLSLFLSEMPPRPASSMETGIPARDEL